MDPTTLILPSVEVVAGLERVAPGHIHFGVEKLLQRYCNRAGTGQYTVDKEITQRGRKPYK